MYLNYYSVIKPSLLLDKNSSLRLMLSSWDQIYNSFRIVDTRSLSDF